MNALRPLRPVEDGTAIEILDQTRLPHTEDWRRIATVDEMAEAIRTLRVRGAPLIGVAAAWGLVLALRADASDAALGQSAALLVGTRPTAVNLTRAVERVRQAVVAAPRASRSAVAAMVAAGIAEEEVAASRAIARHGQALLVKAHRVAPDRPVQVLTHCNAGWLATLELGTALAPVYQAHADGIPVHVWVDETRPRNQGWLTAWELGRAGVPHTVVADNASGHLLQRGRIDLVLVGADRIARNGDVANKVGTWLKALAADESGTPFYVVAPGSTIDWALPDGRAIPIEERDPEELREVAGLGEGGDLRRVRLAPRETPVGNPAFDVTPARYITAVLTERGLCPATEAGLRAVYPDAAAVG